MILTDVNVLVYAFRREAEHHERYSRWLRGVIAGGDELALHDLPLSSFLRIVSNPRIFADPAPTSAALEFTARLQQARRARWLPSSATTWTTFTALAAQDDAVRGNLVPDAFLAALALAHGCRLATADRAFARFAGLDWFTPV